MTNTLWLVFSGDSSESDALRFQVKGIRNALSLASGRGLKKMKAGFQYVTNVCFQTGGLGNKAIPTAKQIPGAIVKLEKALDEAPFYPYMICVENEENWQMVNGSVSAYVAWFTAVAKVAKARGILITNGGTTMGAFLALGYSMLLAENRLEEAAAFKKRNRISYAMLNQKDWVLAEMAQLKAAGFGDMAWNIHYQFGSTESVNDFNTCLEALSFYGWKRRMSNEIGKKVIDPKMVILFTQAMLGLETAGLYNATGESGKAKPYSAEEIDAFISVAHF